MKLHRDLGITQKTAWFLGHRLREAWRAAESGFKLDGVLEADETYVGGLEKNKHADKKLRLAANCGILFLPVAAESLPKLS